MRISDWSSDVCSSDLAGCDGDFGKGGNLYDRGNGDPSVTPNPCLGPIAKPPFYAVAMLPTPLGTSRGLSADVHAREIGRAHVCTTVTNAHLVCGLLLEKKTTINPLNNAHDVRRLTLSTH